MTASFAGDEQHYLLPASASYTLTVTKRSAGLAFSAKSYEAALGLTTDDWVFLSKWNAKALITKVSKNVFRKI